MNTHRFDSITLDIVRLSAFSQFLMKLQTVQIERLVRNVFDRLKEKELVEFKKPEKMFLRGPSNS